MQLAAQRATARPVVAGAPRPRRVLACHAVLQQRPQPHASSSCPTFGQQAAAALAAASLVLAPASLAADEGRVLCDASCESSLESVAMVTTPSGLQYKDIVAGKGPAPITGFQVVVNYVAMTEKGRVFENSLDKSPFDVRVGAGQVIPGLDEGMASMRVGGVRRLYIPGALAFPKPVKAAAGRPSVPANTPVVFDVQLLYIPGLEADDE